MDLYKIELEYPLDPNVESYLYAYDVFIIEEPKPPSYGSTEIYVKTNLNKDKLLDLIDVKRIIKRIKRKCDMCSNVQLSDETSVGYGFEPFCIKGHWGGFSKEDFDDNIKYCTFKDDCKDFNKEGEE